VLALFLTRISSDYEYTAATAW